MRREGALQRSTGKRKADVRVSAKCKAPRVVGSSFAVCPLCSKSVIKALLDMHVNSCKGAPPSSAPFSVVDAHASGAHLHSEAAVTQPTEGGSQTQAASQPAAPRPAAHKHSGGKADGPGVTDPAQDKLQDHKHNLEVRISASPGAEQPAIVQSAHSRPPAAAQRPPQPTGHSAPREDAFAHLMRQQRERSQTWTFFLGARPDGGLFWHIWRGDKGAGGALDQETRKQLLSGAQWSATTQAPLAALQCQVSAGSPAKPALGKVALKLVTNIAAGPAAGGESESGSGSGPMSSNQWQYTGTASLVKSALQKNVRMRRCEEAVRCAAHLLAEDPSGLLRRVCVIALEDALLHPQLPLLVWLMAAVAHGYQLNQALRGACLGVVRDLARAPVRDCLSAGSTGLEQAEEAGAAAQEAQGMAPECACLVTSLLLRAAYGGMAGDVAMLRRYARIWLHRFQGGSTPPPLLQAPGLPRLTTAHSWTWPAFLEEQFKLPGRASAGDRAGPLRPDDIPVSAVDFHVSNVVEELLARPAIREAAARAAAATGRDAADCLRTAMWRHRSSVNLRCPLQVHHADPVCQGDEERRHLGMLWSVACKDARSWSESYIKARFRAVRR